MADHQQGDAQWDQSRPDRALPDEEERSGGGHDPQQDRHEHQEKDGIGDRLVGAELLDGDPQAPSKVIDDPLSPGEVRINGRAKQPGHAESAVTG